jgi:hypothetical protein
LSLKTPSEYSCNSEYVDNAGRLSAAEADGEWEEDGEEEEWKVM